MYHYVGVRFVKNVLDEHAKSKIYIYEYDKDAKLLFVGERYKIISENGYNYNNAMVEICSLYSFANKVSFLHGCSIKKISGFLYAGLNPCCRKNHVWYNAIKTCLHFSDEEFYSNSNQDKPILYNGKAYKDIKEVLDDLSKNENENIGVNFDAAAIATNTITITADDIAKATYGSSIPDMNTICDSGTYYNSIYDTHGVSGTYKKLDAIGCNQTVAHSKNDNKINDKKENNMNIFGNLNFGSYRGSDIKLSMKGLAYKTNENTYVAYDKVEKNLVNVTDFIIDIDSMIYMLPASLKDIVIGDIINHNKEFMIVTAVNTDNNSITVISPKNKEIKTIMPERNIFGFDFIAKLFCPIGDNIFGTVDKDNPFGTMLPFLMMKDGNLDMKSLMLAQMMTGCGSIDFQNNPMMLYFFMDNKNNGEDNMFPLFVMNMMNIANKKD